MRSMLASSLRKWADTLDATITEQRQVIAILLWMYEKDAYNVGGCFETVQLAYKYAMNLIQSDDCGGLDLEKDFIGFCIEQRYIIQDGAAELEKENYAHEEIYFDKKGRLRYSLRIPV